MSRRPGWRYRHFSLPQSSSALRFTGKIIIPTKSQSGSVAVVTAQAIKKSSSFPLAGGRLAEASSRVSIVLSRLAVLLLQKLTSGVPRFLLASVCIQQGIASGHLFWQGQK